MYFIYNKIYTQYVYILCIYYTLYICIYYIYIYMYIYFTGVIQSTILDPVNGKNTEFINKPRFEV